MNSDQRSRFDALLAELSTDQQSWLGGWLTARTGGGPALAAPATAGAAVSVPLTILYGTESGNSEELAARTAKSAKSRGFKPTVKNMADLSPADLAKSERLVVIVSTWGDGEPPETATSFYKGLMSEDVDLSKVSFSVCALGDTSYEQFCKTGKDVDARLATLGGKRVAERRDCDVDYEDSYQEWVEAAFTALAPAAVAAVSEISPVVAPVGSTFGKKNPFPAELLDKVLLNGRGSAKETWHYELSLEGSGLTYEPGDALAVLPVNAPDVVEDILRAARLSGSESVTPKGGQAKPLAEALREDFEITTLSKAVLKKLAEVAPASESLAALLADEGKEELREYLWGRWIADAIRQFAPDGLSAEALTGVMRKLPPRLYSIASSPLEHPGEVHLTVASVRYDAHGAPRKGVASTYLADLVENGDSVPVFTQPNKNFRLPTEGDTPIIMVGPGTGIAPFRSFVEHRAASGASGKNWLIFGDQRYQFDFLYQLEWQDHLKNGSLHKLDVAFSRDQPEKVYVQDRIRQRAAELFAWLEEGAHFYVCGDASRMAHDVHEALIDVVTTAGGRKREEAEAYLEDLKKSKRYQRDVY
ncbi:sulfite reductase (NADPH) flavoprotein alpha-component [Haloferula luteola]|uniref:assimilatory sulfite reductase (NADPH) n=1 Tax=Haloferula luteola TaxID=595692 RepID=A0A840V5E4_9BACT|nr:assimilatory sulfite reductase (NADPH) flavoprotein subunit [Haloferula luteola]MBB5350008.1 sulfite reductase (NADPH) flavoprotein alpha-component [Haloferula luteola]